MNRVRGHEACHRTFASLLIPVTLAACVSTTDGARTTESADTLNPVYEDPAMILGSSFSRKLSDVISPADISTGAVPTILGVADDAHIPYPDFEWHFFQGGIDRKWNAGEPSPLEKYMALADAQQVAGAKSWNFTNHGAGIPNLPRWFGLCAGWSGAATTEAPLRHAVDARIDSTGRPAACAPGSNGCVHFEIGDITGLLAEIYSDAPARFIGGRCNTSTVVFDENGRVDREKNKAPGAVSMSTCQGLNPASLMMVLGHRVRDAHKSIVIDYQDASLTNAIWNRPVWGYAVHRFSVIDQDQAIDLVGGSARPLHANGYVWNANARGFAMVDLSLQYVRDSEREGPAKSFVSGRDRTGTMRLVAVLELDRPGTDPEAALIGGEYIVDDTVAGSARLTVPPFVWVNDGAPLENTWTYPWWVSAPHNPYLRSSTVLALAALAR